MNNQLITRDQNEPTEVQSVDTSPNRLIEMAITQNADVDKLERLMQMQERWEANQAVKSFNRAMSKFQSECPRIVKSKQGHGYKYATLGDIQAQIKATANQCGISWRWEIVAQDSEKLTARCIVTHVDGHSQATESTTFVEPPNKMQSRTQMVGVATTYAQRYSLIGALGISTADEDMDARLPDEYKEKPPYKSFRDDKEAITNAIEGGRSAESVIEGLEEKFKLTERVKQAIIQIEKEQGEKS